MRGTLGKRRRPLAPAAVALLFVLLSGCISNGGREQVHGADAGPGACTNGEVRIALSKVNQGETNWTVEVLVTNGPAGSRIGGFGGLAIYWEGGDVFSRELNRKAHPTYFQYPGESRLLEWEISDVPRTTWTQFSITYVDHREEVRDYPIHLMCSLSGDNAPYAFEK